MKKQYSISLWAVALVLISGGTLLADPYLTSLEIGPQAPAPVNRGSSASYDITITRVGDTNSELYLSALGLSQEATASFSPNPVLFLGGATTGTATMLISTTAAILPGLHPFSVKAQLGKSHNILTNTATLDVTLGSPGVVPLANGGWCFAFAAQPGQIYQIQANTNFSSPSWTTLCTTNSGTNNLLVFFDRDVARYPCRFYRSVGQ